MEIIRQNIAAEANSYNEATVRFRIIDPIIKALGYSDGENIYVSLEDKLEWPYIHIGRRSKKDNPVGYPDYRAGLKGARGSFIIEAKAGYIQLSDIDVEQAHSYAAHAQVGANYFVLCNGVEFRIYETLSGPKPSPMVVVPISEINSRYHEIENILSPSRLEANCKVEYDTRLKLCEGVGSSLKVRSGMYKITDYVYKIFVNDQDATELIRANMPTFQGLDQQLELFKTSFQLRVDEGKMHRDEEGRICAWAHLAGATVQNYEGMKLLGVEQITLATSSEFLSTNADNPTIFESTKDFALQKGASIPQLFGGFSQMDADISGEVFIKFAMYLDGRILKGQYIACTDYHSQIPMAGAMRLEFDLAGEFQMEVEP